MITVIVNDNNTKTIERLIATTAGRLPAINVLTYQDLFQKQQIPTGCVVFADFDLLNDFEMDAACTAATILKQNDAGSIVLNDPRFAKERFELLTGLESSGANPIEVTRLKGREPPRKYPLFIRYECGCLRPDTDLILSEQDLDGAMASLTANGNSLRGRIAVSFADGRDADGYYRKYGAFRIGDHIIPQHILRSSDWVVKSDNSELDEAFNAEEFAFVQDNPHRTELMRFFQAANIEFGRVDYTLCDGKIVVFEINTNPTFPRFTGGDPSRERRRSIILNNLAQALRSVDAAGTDEAVTFDLEHGVKRYIRAPWKPVVVPAKKGGQNRKARKPKRTWWQRRWIYRRAERLLAAFSARWLQE